MYHRTHWTVEKITKRLALIEPLVHRRHAYLPAFQMQELPDPMTSAMWSSWVELNPKTAEKLGIVLGDEVDVTSNIGTGLMGRRLCRCRCRRRSRTRRGFWPRRVGETGGSGG